MRTKSKKQTESYLVRSIQEYLKIVFDIHKEWSKTTKELFVWYRGIKGPKTELLPGLYRPDNGSKLSIKKALKLENNYAIDFLVNYEALHIKTINDPWAQYAAMQHYGLKTRILDWTKSPLIGLFFALYERNHINNDSTPTVWVMNPACLNKRSVNQSEIIMPNGFLNKKYLPTALLDSDVYKRHFVKYPIALELPLSNRRMVSQQAAVTVHGKDIDPIEKTLKNKGLCKICIDPTKAKKMLQELFLLGITEDYIYQDLDSLCLRINRQYQKIGFMNPKKKK